MAFHAKDGWFFKRNDDGSVTITPPSVWRCVVCGAFWRKWPDGTWSLLNGEQKPGSCCDNAAMVDQIERVVWDGNSTFDSATWQSIIASVSSEGEENYRFYVAGKFHNGGMKRCRHILKGNFVGAGKPCGLFFDVHYMLDADHKFED